MSICLYEVYLYFNLQNIEPLPNFLNSESISNSVSDQALHKSVKYNERYICFVAKLIFRALYVICLTDNCGVAGSRFFPLREVEEDNSKLEP